MAAPPYNQTMNMMASNPHNPLAHLANPPPDTFEEYEDEDELDLLSPIEIIIRTPIHVNGNNNTVSIDAGTIGSRVAYSVIQSLRQLNGLAGGIPVIDQDGRPRPIKVEIDADMQITGSDNTVGENAVLMKMIKLAATRAPPPPAEKQQDQDKEQSLQPSAKRARTE
jgi:hypothetical protein